MTKMPSLFKRKRDLKYSIIIYSNSKINSKYKYDINIHTNILTISQIFQKFLLGYIHIIFVDYSRNRIEATVTFNDNVVLKNLTRNGIFFNQSVLIPDTNVYIQII